LFTVCRIDSYYYNETEMGPTCQLLLNTPLNDKQLFELTSYLNKIGDVNKSSASNTWDFWVKLDRVIPRDPGNQGCLFSIYVWEGLIAEHSGTYEIEEYELIQLEQKTGFRPYGRIQLDAGCNGEIDHSLLGKIASDLLAKFGGFIDFGGDLNLESEESVPGNIYTIFSENEKHGYQIADQTFLNYWMNHDQFRMIK
jgi:hypothetical protein